MKRTDLIKKYHNDLIAVTNTYSKQLDTFSLLIAVDILKRRLERLCDTEVESSGDK